MALDTTEKFSAETTNVDDSSAVNFPQYASDSSRDYESGLDLDIDDRDFKDAFRKLEADYKLFYTNKYNLYKRRAENEDYRFGRQLKYVKLKNYNQRYLDPVIYDAESYLKPIIFSQMPDILVKPAQDTDQSKQTADVLSQVFTNDLDERRTKRVLQLAFEHTPVGYVGVIKALWNPEIGKFGDYDFCNVHYDNVIFDYTAKTNSTDDMWIVAQAIEQTVEDWLVKFPEARTEFLAELHRTGVFDEATGKPNETNKKGLMTAVKGWEVWFDWKEKRDNDQWERISGVCWLYEECILKRIRNPHWDWEGTPQLFSYQEIEKEPDEKKLRSAAVNPTTAPQLGLQETETYNNYFNYPRKPFYFMGYEQWGKQPLDETSRIEMSLYLQMNIDKRGRQVAEMWDKASGKHIWSTMSGLKKEDIEEMDMNDPDSDAIVDGEVSKVHAFIQSALPTPEMLADLANSRNRIFEIMGVNDPTRGANSEEDTATQTQIEREGAFTRADDLADATINAAAEWLTEWKMQMIKLRYSENHLRRLVGPRGALVFAQLHRDMVEDGMEVVVTASGVDKLKAKQDAYDKAKLRMIDPLTFNEATGDSDPVGNTERLMLFMTSPMMYMQRYLGTDMSQQAGAMGQQLNGTPQGTGQMAGAQQAMLDIQQLIQGTMPPVPQQVDQTYVQAINQFIDSPNFGQLPPQVKSMIIQFAHQVVQLAQQLAAGAQQGQQPQGGQPPAPQMGGTGATAGPVAGGPSPQNTSAVPINTPGDRTGASSTRGQL